MPDNQSVGWLVKDNRALHVALIDLAPLGISTPCANFVLYGTALDAQMTTIQSGYEIIPLLRGRRLRLAHGHRGKCPCNSQHHYSEWHYRFFKTCVHNIKNLINTTAYSFLQVFGLPPAYQRW